MTSSRPEGSSSSTRQDDAVRRATIIEKVLAVVIGVLTLITAAFALANTRASNAKSEVEQSQQVTSRDLAALQRQFDDLRMQEDAVRAENAQLRSRLNLPTPTPGSALTTATNSPALPGDVSVRHEGPLVLAGSTDADLDAPASNSQWITNSGYPELQWGRGGTTFYVRSLGLYLGSRHADYETCRSTTGYRSGTFDAANLSQGPYFCVKTSDNRYAAVEVKQLTPTQISLYVVAYDPPDQ